MPLRGLAATRAVLTAMSYAGVLLVDRRLRILHVDGDLFRRHGYDAEQWCGKPLREVLSAQAAALLEGRWASAVDGIPQAFEYVSVDGTRIYWLQMTPIRDHDDVVTSVLTVAQDVGERLRVAVELDRSEARVRESERLAGLGSWELAVGTGVITFTEGLARLLGIAAEVELDLETYEQLVHPADRGIMRQSIAECLRVGSGTCEYRIIRTDATERLFSIAGELSVQPDGARHLRGAVLDITDQRAAERERFEAVSLFEQGFDVSPIGMLLTTPGDGRFLRANDAMCVLLGRSREQLLDLTIDEVTHPDDLARDAASRWAMIDGTLDHYETEKRYLRPDGTMVWVGLHVAPVQGPDGRARAFFTQVIDITERKERDAHNQRNLNDALWLGRIRHALDHDRLVLHAQPIIDLTTGEATQQELLLRMRADDGTIIAPGEFLPIAERYGLIAEIDRWVIRQAAAIAATGVPAEFNVSGASIGVADVLAELESAIQHTGADPSLLTIEVTETAIMENLDAGRVFAEGVRALGCSLALDDFGTGWAGLSYLKHFPTQQLKIDLEFVQDLATSNGDERLIRGIVGLAREFGLTTVAEGIEDEQTLVRLRALGVDHGQGYLFGRPRPLPGSEQAGAVSLRSPSSVDPGAPDPNEVVRQVYAAFADRDRAAALEHFHPDATIRTLGTSRLTGRDQPYQGHAGIQAYLNDIERVWDDLVFTPTAFHPAEACVIVFGSVTSTTQQRAEVTDVLWVWRLDGDLVTSVDVFNSRHRR